MISTLKDRQGLIHSYIEWQVLDPTGYPSDGGEYIFIRSIWIHKRFRGMRAYRSLIDKIDRHEYTKGCHFVYWEIVRDKQGRKIIDEENREVGSRKMSKLHKRQDILDKIFDRTLVPA